MTEAKTHWKKLTNPDYIGAYALEPGKDMILTIKSVSREMVTGAEGKKEECTVANFAENVKPMILNRTNCKTIEKVYSTPFVEDWGGLKIQIYTEHGIRVGKETTDALRIRPFVPKQSGPVAPICTDCNKPIGEHQGASGAQIAKATYEKYGKSLCLECAAILKEKQIAAVIPDPLGGANGNA